jgi:hypothetical protein
MGARLRRLFSHAARRAPSTERSRRFLLAESYKRDAILEEIKSLLFLLMEFIFEIVLGLLWGLAELLLQLIFEALFELGLHTVREPFKRPKPNPWVATVGYVMLGAMAGGISLWIFPASLIPSPAGRIVNLVVTPFVAGGVMAAFGAWRRRRGEELLRLDRFAYGFLFALAMAVVRFSFARS